MRTGLWRIVRELLWRIIDPSIAFKHVVRRALFAHRVVSVLKAMPAFAQMTEPQLARMVRSRALAPISQNLALLRSRRTPRCADLAPISRRPRADLAPTSPRPAGELGARGGARPV